MTVKTESGLEFSDVCDDEHIMCTKLQQTPEERELTFVDFRDPPGSFIAVRSMIAKRRWLISDLGCDTVLTVTNGPGESAFNQFCHLACRNT